MALWDLRSPSTPLQSIIPDNSPVLNMKADPDATCLAVVTGVGNCEISGERQGSYSVFDGKAMI